MIGRKYKTNKGSKQNFKYIGTTVGEFTYSFLKLYAYSKGQTVSELIRGMVKTHIVHLFDCNINETTLIIGVRKELVKKMKCKKRDKETFIEEISPLLEKYVGEEYMKLIVSNIESNKV